MNFKLGLNFRFQRRVRERKKQKGKKGREGEGREIRITREIETVYLSVRGYIRRVVCQTETGWWKHSGFEEGYVPFWKLAG